MDTIWAQYWNRSSERRHYWSQYFGVRLFIVVGRYCVSLLVLSHTQHGRLSERASERERTNGDTIVSGRQRAVLLLLVLPSRSNTQQQKLIEEENRTQQQQKHPEEKFDNISQRAAVTRNQVCACAYREQQTALATYILLTSMANIISISSMKITNPIKEMVSKSKKRFTQDGFNLDLSCK